MSEKTAFEKTCGRYRIYILSPANTNGERAKMLFRPRANFDLAARLQREGIPMGEAFAFMSGLYFRGKLAYAQAFAAPPPGIPGSFVITSSYGLVPPETTITVAELQQIAAGPIDAAGRRYRAPPERSCRRPDGLSEPAGEFVLRG